jgi:hypothetical protein
MSRCLRILSLLLLAVWLPAAMHCQLETAGLLPETCAHANIGGAEDESCAGDGCNLAEGGAVKTAGGGVKMTPPASALLADTDFSRLLAGVLIAPRELTAALAVMTERARDWVPCWCFARRAAPSPRAPAGLV